MLLLATIVIVLPDCSDDKDEPDAGKRKHRRHIGRSLNYIQFGWQLLPCALMVLTPTITQN